MIRPMPSLNELVLLAESGLLPDLCAEVFLWGIIAFSSLLKYVVKAFLSFASFAMSAFCLFNCSLSICLYFYTIRSCISGDIPDRGDLLPAYLSFSF